MRENSARSNRTAHDTQVDRSRTGLARRNVLKGGLTAVSLLTLGSGAVGTVGASQDTGRFNEAPGRGGEAVVPEEDFRGDEKFRITERTGDSAFEIDFVEFQCEGEGESILLVGWFFEYEGESERRTLYTRSNNIDTDVVYEWKPEGEGAKLCEGAVEDTDFLQTPYRATGPQ